MNVLIKRAWRHFDKFKEQAVKPSIPLLYFGDLEAYRSSRHKIVTVGLNPSCKEFPRDLERFKLSRNNQAYIRSLNNYFKKEPYDLWFSTYENVLSGLQASYYPCDSVSSSAVHTDLCTPIATKSKWCEVSKLKRELMVSEGREIWCCLMERLRPDAIICSIAERYLQSLNITDEKEILSIELKGDGKPRKKPFALIRYRINFNSRHSCHFFWGQAANTPFGSLLNEDKAKIGESILRILNNKFYRRGIGVATIEVKPTCRSTATRHKSGA